MKNKAEIRLSCATPRPRQTTGSNWFSSRMMIREQKFGGEYGDMSKRTHVYIDFRFLRLGLLHGH